MAFSMHLWWELGGEVREVAATLEVLVPPSVDRLYFWALQASFMKGGESVGAAHLGLQWNPRFPGHRAANWGGYDPGGAILAGSESPLPSTPGDPNTRDFPWEPGRAYRLRISPAPAAGWRGEITDQDTGAATALRDLYAGGTRLAHVVVWSELFCRCDDPTAVVRWSALEGSTAGGEPQAPKGLRVNSHGCPNTNVYRDGRGIVQATATERTTPQGALIRP